jgi:hypothetical protein
LAKKELAVGDSTALEIIYSTGTHRGLQTKSPLIETNQGPPPGRVTIRATVLEKPDSTYPITIIPYRLSVSRADTIEISEAKFKITNVSDKDLGIKLVDSPEDYFAITLPNDIGPGQSAEGTLKLNPAYLAEPFEKSITLEVNDDAHTRFTLPVIRRFIGAGRPEEKPAAQSIPHKPGGGGNH